MNDLKAHCLLMILVDSGPTPIKAIHTPVLRLFFTDNYPGKRVCGLSVIGLGPDLMWIVEKRGASTREGEDEY